MRLLSRINAAEELRSRTCRRPSSSNVFERSDSRALHPSRRMRCGPQYGASEQCAFSNCACAAGFDRSEGWHAKPNGEKTFLPA
jgi:hypothetical protein